MTPEEINEVLADVILDDHCRCLLLETVKYLRKFHVSLRYSNLDRCYQFVPGLRDKDDLLWWCLCKRVGKMWQDSPLQQYSPRFSGYCKTYVHRLLEFLFSYWIVHIKALPISGTHERTWKIRWDTEVLIKYNHYRLSEALIVIIPERLLDANFSRMTNIPCLFKIANVPWAHVYFKISHSTWEPTAFFSYIQKRIRDYELRTDGVDIPWTMIYHAYRHYKSMQYLVRSTLFNKQIAKWVDSMWKPGGSLCKKGFRELQELGLTS